MLKKIVIGVAILLVVAGASGGFVIYHFYQEVQNIAAQSVSRYQSCPTLTPSPASTSTGTSPPPTVIPTNDQQAGASRSRSFQTTPRPKGTRLAPCEFVPKGPPPTLSGKRRINILLLGSDNDKKQWTALLTQTMMVVTIDPVHKKVSLLSIPRDLWVPIPGYSTPGDQYSYQKIDAAFAFGEANARTRNKEQRFLAGVRLARATVEDNLGIQINDYAWVGLSGFIKVIDSLGGIDIVAQHPIVDDSYPYDVSGNNPYAETRVYIPAGAQYMDGPTALEYARSRHADLVGDFGRGARQEQVLLAIRKKANFKGINDIGTISSLAAELQNYVKSDIGGSGGLAGLEQLQSYYDFAKKLKPSRIQRLVLAPPKYSYATTIDLGVDDQGVDQQADIVQPIWNKINPVVKKMFAPIKLRTHTTKPKKPLKLSPDLALALFTRVSGATPPPQSLPPAKRPVNPVTGRIFFNEGGDVWSYNGKSFYQVTHGGAISDPSLTGNTRKLVYARRFGEYSNIYVRDRTTHKTTQITNDEVNDGIVGHNVWAFASQIAPNGKAIIYASDAYKNTDASTGYIDLALYRYDPATGASTQITLPDPGAGGDTDPRFDPANLNQIIYTDYYYRPNSAVGSRLMLLNLTTDQSQALTPRNARISQASWQHNGHHVAFIRGVGEGTALYEAPFNHGHIEMSKAKEIAGGLVSEPEFSPDSRHLAFYKLVGNTFQMWSINLKNGWPHGRPYELFSARGLIASSPIVWTK